MLGRTGRTETAAPFDVFTGRKESVQVRHGVVKTRNPLKKYEESVQISGNVEEPIVWPPHVSFKNSVTDQKAREVPLACCTGRLRWEVMGTFLCTPSLFLTPDTPWDCHICLH